MLFRVLFLFLFAGCQLSSSPESFRWLESLQNSKAVRWINTQAISSYRDVSASSRFVRYMQDVVHANRTSRFLNDTVCDGFVYRFVTNSDRSPLLSRKKIESDVASNDSWDHFFDFRDLAKKYERSIVFSSFSCSQKNILVDFSIDQTDKHVFVEIDLSKRLITRVIDNLVVPSFELLFDGTILIYDRNSYFDKMAVFGHKRQYEIPSSGKIYGIVSDGKRVIVNVASSSRQIEPYLYNARMQSMKKVNVPNSMMIVGVGEGFYLAKTLQAMNGVRAGSLIKISAITFRIQNVIFSDDGDQKLGAYSQSGNKFFYSINKALSTVVKYLELKDSKVIPYSFINNDEAEISQVKIDPIRPYALVDFEGYFVPKTQSLYDFSSREMSVLNRNYSSFQESNFKKTLFWADSSDGAKIPYLVFAPRSSKMNGLNKVILSVYGGFGYYFLRPTYLNEVGRLWLEDGNIYVLAGIRGGGEFGETWHQSAVQKNKLRSVNDIVSIINDLENRKISSSKHIGLTGVSNGAFLAVTTAILNPTLVNGVVARNGIFDFKNYMTLDKLGSNWIAEYGDPRTEDWEYIKQFSPFELASKAKDLPQMLIFGSKFDDRVNPAHSRKMVAKLQAKDQKILYFEAQNGGHSVSTQWEEYQLMTAMEYAFFDKML